MLKTWTAYIYRTWREATRRAVSQAMADGVTDAVNDGAKAVETPVGLPASVKPLKLLEAPRKK